MKATLEQISARPTRHRSAMLVGPPKTGKTQSLSTLPKSALPMWYCNFDSGDAAEPLLRKAVERGWGGTDFVEHTYGNVGNRLGLTQVRPRGREVWLEFAADINGLFEYVDPSTGFWKRNAPIVLPETIVIDSMSAYQNVVMDFVLAMNGHDLGAPKTDARQDYGQAMGKIEETIETILSLPVNLIATFHEIVLQDELTSQITALPKLFGQGTLAPNIGRHFGAVLYSRVTGDRYEWITRPEGFVKSAGIRSLEGVPTKIAQDFGLIWQSLVRPAQ